MIGDPRVEFDVLLVMAALACVTFIITTIILWIYSRPGLNILVLVTVFIGWFCSFSLSWLIPIDMLPSENLHKVRIAWEILYWVSFCLTWFLSPTLRLYHASGYLTRWSRFKDALLVNLYYNGIIAIVGIVLFVLILALKKQQFVSSLMSVAVALSTAWGLTLLVLLLGYGIVEVPRRLWNVKNKSRSLAMLYRDIVETDNERDEAMDRLADAYKATNIYHRRLEVENFSLDEIQALREFISLFKQKFPTLIQGYRPVEEISTFSAKADTAKISIHLLASMHAEIKRDLHEVRRASARFEAIYERIVSMTKDGPENAVDDTLNNGGLW